MATDRGGQWLDPPIDADKDHILGSSDAPITLVERLGSETLVYVKPEGAEQITVKLDGGSAVARGDLVGLQVDAAHCHLFGPDGSAIGAPSDATGQSAAAGANVRVAG